MTRSALKFIGVLALVSSLYVVLTNLIVISYNKFIVNDTNQPSGNIDVGLVLGTSPWTPYGKENQFFEGRVAAASDLYHRGRVKHFILSGDNAQMEYNEPVLLQKALEKKGVQAKDMTLDYAGFRTLDSVVRAGEVFGQDSIIIITQAFHLPRALFIARKNGITAYGYEAGGSSLSVPVLIREIFARSLSVADVYIFRTRPKFLGKKEPLIIRPQ